MPLTVSEILLSNGQRLRSYFDGQTHTPASGVEEYVIYTCSGIAGAGFNNFQLNNPYPILLTGVISNVDDDVDYLIKFNSDPTEFLVRKKLAEPDCDIPLPENTIIRIDPSITAVTVVQLIATRCAYLGTFPATKI